MQATVLWYVKPGHAELREEEIAARKDREVSVRALFGAISRGTERLVYCGGVPATEEGRMRGPYMAGQFPFPVKYGYPIGRPAENGVAEPANPLRIASHPHPTLVNVSAAPVVP